MALNFVTVIDKLLDTANLESNPSPEPQEIQRSVEPQIG